MEKYQSIFKNLLVGSDWKFQFSIGSPKKDSQYLSVYNKQQSFILDICDLRYFSFIPKQRLEVLGERVGAIANLTEGVYAVHNSSIIEDLNSRSCGLQEMFELYHYILVNEQLVIEVVTDGPLDLKEGVLEKESEEYLHSLRQIDMTQGMVKDFYFLFTCYYVDSLGPDFYLLGQKNSGWLAIESLTPFYMIDEAVDFTLSPKDKNYQYEPSEINRYMYNVINEVSEEFPTLALHGLLDYHVYFFDKTLI